MSTPALPRTVASIEAGIAGRLHIGAQAYVSRAGQPIADLAIGHARAGEWLRSDTLLLWMSAVKPLLAVAIAQLWERGVLALDDPVAAHIPEFGVNGKEAITLRHVLTHTGGFPSVAAGWSDAPTERILAEIYDATLEPGWVPGRDAGYHVSSGWYVLGEIVRRRDGRPFNQYVREAICVPLGMPDSWVGMPRERHRAYGPRVATIHVSTDAAPQPHFFWPWSGSEDGCALYRPGGSAWGPIRELGYFYEALLQGGARGGGRILSPQSTEVLTTRHTVGMRDRVFGTRLDRGLGVVADSKHYGPASAWFGRHCSPRTFGHGGYLCSLGFADPDHQLAVAVAFNGMTDDGRHARRVTAAVEAIYEDLGLAQPAAVGESG